MSTPLSSSAGNWSNSTPRLSPVEACSRPFSVAALKSGLRPRTLTFCERPELRLRCVARPGRREMASATVLSGSLPTSSALMASTTPSLFFLTEMALSMPRRMPVTVMVWLTAGSGAEAAASGAATCCACAAPMPITAMAAAAATGVALSRVRAGRDTGCDFFMGCLLSVLGGAVRGIAVGDARTAPGKRRP